MDDGTTDLKHAKKAPRCSHSQSLTYLKRWALVNMRVIGSPNVGRIFGPIYVLS